jgi:hypothetical protein
MFSVTVQACCQWHCQTGSASGTASGNAATARTGRGPVGQWHRAMAKLSTVAHVTKVVIASRSVRLCGREEGSKRYKA